MLGSRFSTVLCVLGGVLVLGSLLSGCQTLREVANLKNVEFRLDRTEDAQLAGVDLEGIRSRSDLSASDVARLGSALSVGEMPLRFTLFVEARNPDENSVNARLTVMDWVLLLDDRETVSGTFDREVVLPPGTPKEFPLDIRLDLVEFFDQNLQSLVQLAASVGGAGPPTNVKLRVQPTIQTPIGPMQYPNPITVVSEDVGREGR